MHFHRKLLKDGRHMRITRKSKSTGKEVFENNNFVGFKGRDLFIRRRASITSREISSLLIFFNNFGCDLRLAKDKCWRIGCGLSTNELTQVNFNIGKIFITTVDAP
jgi:hypothetical protein